MTLISTTQIMFHYLFLIFLAMSKIVGSLGKFFLSKQLSYSGVRHLLFHRKISLYRLIIISNQVQLSSKFLSLPTVSGLAIESPELESRYIRRRLFFYRKISNSLNLNLLLYLNQINTNININIYFFKCRWLWEIKKKEDERKRKKEGVLEGCLFFLSSFFVFS